MQQQGKAEKESTTLPLTYQFGFGNHFESETVPGTLPQGQNNPQVCKGDLFTEQLSGTAFTAPRHQNLRTWLYRKHPSVGHEPFKLQASRPLAAQLSNSSVTPNQLRWSPPDEVDEGVDFVDALFTFCGSGNALQKEGYAIHTYTASASMQATSLSNADGDLLIVPQSGCLHIRTELGLLDVPPGSICVIQCGMRFAVDLRDQESVHGYVLEVFGQHFQLPELGPIGANGLANPRDFRAPTACCEEPQAAHTLIQKLGGQLWQAQQGFTPFDVVAWQGNYVPFVYDLALFCPLNTVRVDHADPSVFTVLTCPSAVSGTALADFVIFPPRWLCAEHTFRPPYFHRNCMSEFMGMVRGVYDGKEGGGFQPGGASLHVCMTPHGPDAAVTAKAMASDTSKPARLPDDSLAFMFEVRDIPRVMTQALQSELLEKDYWKCWQGFKTAGASAPAAPRAEANGKTCQPSVL